MSMRIYRGRKDTKCTHRRVKLFIACNNANVSLKTYWMLKRLISITIKP